MQAAVCLSSPMTAVSWSRAASCCLQHLQVEADDFTLDQPRGPHKEHRPCPRRASASSHTALTCSDSAHSPRSMSQETCTLPFHGHCLCTPTRSWFCSATQLSKLAPSDSPWHRSFAPGSASRHTSSSCCLLLCILRGLPSVCAQMWSPLPSFSQECQR